MTQFFLKTMASLAFAFCIVSGTATAATFSAPPTIAGSSTFVTGDLEGTAADGFLGFDLFLTIPTELALNFIVDDGSDGAGIGYQVYSFSPLGLSGVFANGVSYGTGGVSGVVGFRATNSTFFGVGPVSELDKIGLNFLTATGIADGDYTVAYSGTLFNSDDTKNKVFDGRFNVTVVSDVNVIPLPAGGVLMVTGLGSLMLMRRRRRAA